MSSRTSVLCDRCRGPSCVHGPPTRRQPSIGSGCGRCLLLPRRRNPGIPELAAARRRLAGGREAIADLIGGIGQLLEGVLGLTTLIVVALLLVGALLALISGVIRLVRSLKRTCGPRAMKSVPSTPRRRRKRR